MRQFPSKLCSVSVFLLATVPVTAADLQVADLRLSAGMLSRHFEGDTSTTITSSGGSVTTQNSSAAGRDPDSNSRGQLQFVGGSLGAGGGLIWGLGVAVNHARWDDGSQDSYVTTPTVDVLLGYGYAFTPQWHVELTPFGGYGRAYSSVSQNGTTKTSDQWDDYVEYGAKIGAYAALGSLVLGIEVPYLVGKFNPDYTYTDDTNNQVKISDDSRNSGFGVLVSLGGRF
jgi:hypothetical protein